MKDSQDAKAKAAIKIKVKISGKGQAREQAKLLAEKALQKGRRKL